MNKYLIFRTDRIGDFLISAILIKSILSNDPSANITVIASNKNYNYIEGFKYINKVILFQKNLINNIKLILKLRKEKFKSIIVHDNKNRSKIISFFLRSENTIKLKNNKNQTHINIIKDILEKLNFKFSDNSLNILDQKINDFEQSNFVLFHFDEKWIYNNYIKNYIKIEPTRNELINFFKLLISKSKKKLIVTTGKKTPIILNEIINNFKIKSLEIKSNLEFNNLENIVCNAHTLISCHGAISHVAAAKRIRQIDIIDKSYDYNKWSNHFRNYNYIYRDNFSNLSKLILKKL